MNKLAETLSRLGQTDTARIGFGQPHIRSKTPLILAAGKSTKNEPPREIVEAVDLLVFDGDACASPSPPSDWDGLWGVALSNADSEALDGLKESGCQFVLIRSGESGSAMLRDDGMDRGFVAPADLSDRRARAIEDMPFEFLVIQHDGGSSLGTIGGVLALQETASLFNMHIFLEVQELPPIDAIEALRDMPISAVLFDADSTDVQELARLREAISKLEQREDRGKRVPALSLSLGRGNNADRPDHNGDDWEDDLARYPAGRPSPF